MSTILIVDDSSTMRKIIAMHLSQSGLEVDRVVMAENGVEALEILDNEKVDLVLTDMNMPEMGGLAFLSAVRDGDRHYNSIPIVVVSTESESGLVREALRIGASHYVQKPFTAEKLAESLGPLLNPACQIP
jgi:two-component system chemotaxis response regulator CheY